MKRNREKYAESIIRTTIMHLKREMPELAVAFKILKLKPLELPIDISTDFRRLFYNPDRVIALKEHGYSYEIDFQIMHVILHGLLGDYTYVKNRRQPAALHLALDQRVDTMLEQLSFMSVKPKLHSSLKTMRVKQPYAGVFGNPHTSLKSKPLKKRANGVWPRIMSDQHSLWTPIYREIMKIEEDDDDDRDKVASEWEAATRAVTGESDKSARASSKLVGDCLKNSSDNHFRGRGHGDLKVEVKRAEGEALDYRDVLSELLTYREDPRENLDSIDPMYYYYSLEHYDDVLLIEPRENEEIQNIGTICVAIDTSGSCSGDIAKIFLNEISALVGNMVSYGVKGKILLIQCDDSIQHEDTYELSELVVEDFDEMALYGYGGTDFRPVFERIDCYREETGENIDALIYLTDGLGDYPEAAAEYPTVFVLTESEWETQRFVPEWIRTCNIEMEDSYGRSIFN